MLALALLTLFAVSSCALKSGTQAKLEAARQQEDEDEDEDENEVAAEEDNGLPHPKKPTAWATRTLVASMPQPAAERVSSCIEQVNVIATEAGNQQDMLNAQNQVSGLVGNDPTLYHYCFYQMMLRLDERLERGGPLMQDVATAFFDQMRSLWILARALDANNGRSQYFDYLQGRYLQISSEYFGRNVQVVGPPMGGLQNGLGLGSQIMAKPAGKAKTAPSTAAPGQ